MKHLHRWSALLAASTFLAAVGCGGAASPSTSAKDQDSAPQNVNVVPVESKRLSTSLVLPGQLTPYESVAIFPKVTGFVDRVLVDRGSKVRANELIAQLSAPELLAQRSQAEAGLETARAQLAAARAKLVSDQATYQHLAAAAKTPGVVAGNDLQVAEQNSAAANAQVEAAQHGVLAAQSALRGVSQLESYLDIRAPFDGVVTERNLHPGALAGPSAGAAAAQPILRIQSIGRLRLVVPVPEAYISGIHTGQQVAFTVPAYPGEVFRAPIARISNDVTQATRTMAIELDVRNTRLTPGSFASVQWPVERDHPTLFVPSNAVTTNLQRTFVIRVRDGKAEWVDVKTGATAGAAVEIFGNLNAGDEVVVPASDALAPGASVVSHQRAKGAARRLELSPSQKAKTAPVSAASCLITTARARPRPSDQEVRQVRGRSY